LIVHSRAAVFDCMSCSNTFQALLQTHLLLLNAGGYDGYFKGSAASAAAAASSLGVTVYLPNTSRIYITLMFHFQQYTFAAVIA